MWKLKEFGWYLYNNYLLIIIEIIILILVLGLIYVFLLFSRETFNTENNFKDIYSDKTMYELIDNFTDADSFSAFRASDKSMERMKNFYYELNDEKSFDFLSARRQSISATGFKGDNRFKHGHNDPFEMNGKTYLDVKSMQMNKKAYDFYQLKIDEGSNFQWNDIDYSNSKIPVILGADYKGIYQIGDMIDANFYTLDVNLEVIGFLQENSTMYHKYEIRHCLDQYIVLPYPESGFENMEKYFRGILYSSMVDGDIVMDNRDDAVQLILNELSEISKHSGYYQYTLIGLPIFIVQYNTVISVVQANQRLIAEVLVLLVCITTFIMGSISYFLYQRRKDIYHAYVILGYPKREIHSMIFREIGFPFLVALILLAIYYYNKFWLYWKCSVYLVLIDLVMMVCIYWFVMYLHMYINKYDE